MLDTVFLRANKHSQVKGLGGDINIKIKSKIKIEVKIEVKIKIKTNKQCCVSSIVIVDNSRVLLSATQEVRELSLVSGSEAN